MGTLSEARESREDRRQQRIEIYGDIRKVGFVWIVIWALSLVCLGFYAVPFGMSFFGSLAAWAFGLSMMSATLGFLFGIPKVLQGPQPQPSKPAPALGDRADSDPPAPGYVQRVNTNLEEISDWLTKIIVGVGLVELKQVPPFLNGFADRIQGSAEHHGVALALIAVYGSTGFLFGYLTTRLYLQGALARADQQGTSTKDVRELFAQSDKIRSELGIPASPAALAHRTPEDKPVDQHLRDLAKRYLGVNTEDPAQRLAEKNQLALEMHQYALEQGISRDALARETDEGLILTLASLALLDPQPNCVARLLEAGQRVERLHVQFRITMAFAELFRRKLAPLGNRSDVEKLLRRYLARADRTLSDAIKTTLGLIQDYGSN